jgi:hypothetical protein
MGQWHGVLDSWLTSFHESGSVRFPYTGVDIIALLELDVAQQRPRKNWGGPLQIGPKACCSLASILAESGILQADQGLSPSHGSVAVARNRADHPEAHSYDALSVPPSFRSSDPTNPLSSLSNSETHMLFAQSRHPCHCLRKQFPCLYHNVWGKERSTLQLPFTAGGQ